MPQLEATKSRIRALKSSGIRLPSKNKQPSRQASGKVLEVQYFRTIKRLINPYFRDIEERLIPVLPEIVEQYKRSVKVDSVKLDQTYGEIITRRVRDIQLGIALQIPLSQLKLRSEDQANDISRFNRRQFDRQVKTVLGVNPLLNETYLEPQVQSFVERNAALIKDIPDQSLARVETKLRTGIEAGESLKTLTETVKNELGIAKNRAKLIARDQTNKFMGKLTELRQTSLGVEEYIWSTSRDERVRSAHAARDGKKFSWDDPPSDGHPGFPIQCFPGESLVVPTAPINRLYRRFHIGELSEIITENGGSAVCTPNHPVFTSTGWKAMKDIQIGDNIANMNLESPEILYSNAHSRQTEFVELFNSFSLIFGIKSTASMIGDFHGDITIDQTIDIVDIDSGLMDAVKSEHFKGFDQEVFANSIHNALRGIELFGFGGFNLAAFKNFSASSSIISLASNLLFLRFGTFTKSEKISLTTIAYRYFVTLKAIRQSFPLAFEFLGEFENRRAIDVLFDKEILIKLIRIMCASVMTNNFMTRFSHLNTEIVGIDIKGQSNLAEILPADISGYSRVNKISSKFYSGHVYNLQTFNNWYGSTTTAGEQLIFSNCRCVAIPVLDEFK